jgi:anaerobic selenocysteine-containing dehydrogenase
MPVSAHTRNVPLGGPTSVVETACPLDCPDACSLAVTVQHGKLVTIDGSHHSPVTGGYICAKVRKFGDRVYGPDRLLYPAVRKGRKGEGRFERVTWDTALSLVVERMERAKATHGGASILPYSYGGSNGLMTQDNLDATLWRRFGTSRLARTVCAAPTGAANLALYGKMPSVTYQDYPEAALIVLWGVNPSTSGIHLVPYVREAQSRGAKLIVVDPRTTPLAKSADVHLAVRPGTDVAVALAIHRYLFENGLADEGFLAAHTHGADKLRERAADWPIARAADLAGIDPSLLEHAAGLYAHSSPALVRCGWGLERNRNGGNAAMAVLALPAVGGKFGVRGGGYSMSNSASWNIERPWIGAEEPNTRLVNMNHLGRALTEYDDPPVDVLFVYNCNPAVTVPDQRRVLRGLEREDLFTVVFEQVMTDTARYADVVLPATTFLEHYDVAKGYGAYHLQVVHPVIAPEGEARPNHEVFLDLGVRLDLSAGDDGVGEAGALLEVTARIPEGLSQALHDGRPAPAPGDGHPIQFVDVFPKTADGRIDLYPASLETRDGLYAYAPDPGTARYPLALISPASEHTISSTLGELRPGVARVKMHPDDAAARAIADGDSVRVFNDLGDVHCVAGVTAEVRVGCVSLAKGLWARSTLNGATSNALVPDSLTDIAGGACFNDARVQIELLGRH